MQVAVFLLQCSVIVVKIKWNIFGEGRSVEGNLPIVVEVDCSALANRVWGREVYLALSHRNTCSNGYATLSAVVHGTVEMVYHTTMLHYIALMCKHLVVWFGWDDKILSLPVLPMYHVAACSKSVVGIVFSCRVECGEIEHHIQVAHLYNLCVAGNGAVRVVGEDRVRLIAGPFLHVVRESHTDTFPFGMGGVLAAGIIIHHELIAEHLLVHTVYCALVLSHIFPPLCILFFVRKDRLVESVP